MENREIAKAVIEAVGGDSNIRSVAHCATRLRIMVNDEAKINHDRVDEIDKVKGSFFTSGQFQIIFGTGTVNKIYDEVVKLGLATESVSEMKEEAKKSGNPLQRLIRTFGDVFVPIIPVLVATGLFMGLRGLITQPEILKVFGTTPESIDPNFLMYTQILTDTAFAFLPALVCWSSFKVFGGSPVIGIVLGLMMVSPNLPNAYAVASGDAHAIMLFDFIPVVGYQGTVLPAFIVGFLGSKLEQKLRKSIPDALDLLVTPFVTMFVMSLAGLLVIGPVFHSLETVVLNATEWILALPFGLAGLILGFFHQLIVVTGIHHIFNFLEVQLLANTGKNAFNAIITCAIAAQGGATLAVGMKTKSKKMKALAFPSALSAFLGITEPAIFGVNLRFVKPFAFGLVGGAVGGWLASIMHLAGTGMAVTVIPGTLLYLNGQVVRYLLVNIVSVAIAFVLTYMFGYEDKEIVDETVANVTDEAPSDEVIFAPISGQLTPLNKVDDQVFSSGMMGQGVAIKPTDDKVYAPADGIISVAFETGHAYGIKTEHAAEILIHIGIDTVSMAGDGFEANVKEGDIVKKGQLLGSFNRGKIEAKGLSDMTMVIVTNTSDYAGVDTITDRDIVTHGDEILSLSQPYEAEAAIKA
ncbi:PTS beta-glucoside transporter subunit EIIBCA [Floricoccus tropicus]|uniref:PTS system sucrose-specific EIIBCA component n=1 Tax=Floricoccus tropicus TaxID=1859473 RepID=A0A1E8GLU1_9LACT|nr:sucrose-specific PTS transporter subunit IIBC [Floricoccus tropicus]OFI49224.1 PTS beta-glucoside transporter subunit EIIBCA [Floricoccus tropicus]